MIAMVHDAAPLDVPAPSTTAVVGTAPAAPVRITDDETTNPWDVIAVLVGGVVGVVSLVLAWRAVLIGKAAAAAAEKANIDASRARAAVAAERRRTFELEVLRDLLDVAGAEGFARRVVVAPGLLQDYSGRLAVLSEEDLKFWREAAGSNRQGILDLLGQRSQESEDELTYAELYEVVYAPPNAVVACARIALLDDVADAIRRRVQARDD